MIADRIKMLRTQKEMSQSGLAKVLGISRASVNAWEMGISVPSTQYIIELSEIFGVSTDYLLCVRRTQALNLDGLTDEDITMLYSLSQHLRAKNNHGDDLETAY